jgi:hypothetical protein
VRRKNGSSLPMGQGHDCNSPQAPVLRLRRGLPDPLTPTTDTNDCGPCQAGIDVRNARSPGQRLCRATMAGFASTGSPGRPGVQHGSRATRAAPTDQHNPPSTSDLPERPPPTSLALVRIAGPSHQGQPSPSGSASTAGSLIAHQAGGQPGCGGAVPP